MSRLAKGLRAASVSETAGLNVEEIFSTDLYVGNNSSKTITNGLDLSGEGGMIWIKNRTDNTSDHQVADTERGVNLPVIHTNNTDSQIVVGSINATNSDGFDIVSAGTGGYNVNVLNAPYVSWSWRKAPKFFDIQTWTGNGTAGRVISHNLGSRPGMIITKCYSDSAPDWTVWHRNRNGTNTHLRLNEINLPQPGEDISAATDTTFTVGNDNRINGVSPRQYVAYIFAHNNGDGEFGPNADADIIKCGSYGGTNSANFVDLGFEPQWILIKNVTSNANWWVLDNMRGISAAGDDAYLRPAQQSLESDEEVALLRPNGFELLGNHIESNLSTETYIYMAIRRGPMGRPESSSDVFAIDTLGNASSTAPGWESGFPVDMAFTRNVNSTSSTNITSRLTSTGYLRMNTYSSETFTSSYTFDFQNGWGDYATPASSTNYSWMWRRAPGYFDAVCYTGNGVAGTEIDHNLGVSPEMIWVKKRDTDESLSWAVWHSALDVNEFLEIDLADPAQLNVAAARFNGVSPTTFTLGVAGQGVSASTNRNNATYIAYLFASLPGISKVGSYTGDGTTGKVIDCGFSNGAKFVLIRRYDNIAPSQSNWSYFDSTRGIVSGNDSQLFFNESDAQDTGHDLVDTTPSGFIVNYDATALSVQETNASGRSYIFYAIAAP